MTNINSIFFKTRTSKSLNLANLFLNMCFIHHASYHNSIFILSYWKRLFTERPNTLHLQLFSEFTALYDIKNIKENKKANNQEINVIKPQASRTDKQKNYLKIPNRKKMRKDSKRVVIINHPVHAIFWVALQRACLG